MLWGNPELREDLLRRYAFPCRRYACLRNVHQLAPWSLYHVACLLLWDTLGKTSFPFPPLSCFFFQTLTKARGFFLPHFKLCLSPQAPSTTLSLLTSIAKRTALSLSSLNSLFWEVMEEIYRLPTLYVSQILIMLSLSFSSEFLNFLINKQGYEHMKGTLVFLLTYISYKELLKKHLWGYRKGAYPGS